MAVAVQRDPGVLSDPAVGLAWLVVPSPGGTRLPGTVVHTLESRLDEVEGAIEEGRVRALAVRPGANGGADRLRALLALPNEGEATAEALSGQAALRRLENLAVPTIAVIDGPCLGAELELALACSYRVASAAVATRFALPQLRLGVIPALGGTVRLPRLIGMDAAQRMIVHGESVDAAAARELGLIDLAVPAGELVEAVERFAAERLEQGRVRARSRRRMHRRLVEETAPGRRLLFARAARRAAGGPAPAAAVRAALRSIADGVSLTLERAFEREAELYGQLAASEAARSLIHAALLEAEASHAHPPEGRAIERVAVLGAHEEGIELAVLLAAQGRSIRLKDRDRGAVATSVHRLRERLAAAEPKRRVKGEREGEDRVEGTVGFGGFGVIDLVVAAPASPETVLRALADCEDHVAERCLLASASPVLPIATLQATLRDPSRALGLVSARPTSTFPVLEIVAGPATDPDTIATACRLALALGRTPVHVADAPGFLVHRLLSVFLAEATRLVHEGTGVEAVDDEMEEFGFAMGPLRRIDALGIDATVRLLGALSGALGPRLAPTPVMRWLAGRRARFYRYRRGRALAVNPELPASSGAAPAASGEEIRERLLLALLNEGARILDEGVVASAADVDLGAIFGVGFPRHRGGLLYHADRAGLETLEPRLQALAERHGESYRPAALLTRLAAGGERFYPARPLASGQAPE